MFIGILFTVLVSVSIGTFGLLAFFGAGKANPEFKKTRVLSFSLFWLFMALVWYLTAISDFFAYLELQFLALISTYTLQTFVGASLVIILYFLNQTVMEGRNKEWYLGIYIFLYALFLINLYIHGLRPRSEDFFTSQITSPEQALLIFTAMFIPLFVLALRLFFRTLASKEKVERPAGQFFLLSSLSLILLGIGGAPDEIGIVTSWLVTASRLLSLISAILAYLAVLALQESEELVI